MNIKIGHLIFDHADYDSDGDVLYLHIGPPQAADGEETPEGHVLRFAPGTQQIVGLTVISACDILKRDGRLIITLPQTIEVSGRELERALQPMADLTLTPSSARPDDVCEPHLEREVK